MPRIDVQGFGLVDFPDSMTDAEIASAIETELAKTQPTKTTAAKAKSPSILETVEKGAQALQDAAPGNLLTKAAKAALGAGMRMTETAEERQFNPAQKIELIDKEIDRLSKNLATKPVGDESEQTSKTKALLDNQLKLRDAFVAAEWAEVEKQALGPLSEKQKEARAKNIRPSELESVTTRERVAADTAKGNVIGNALGSGLESTKSLLMQPGKDLNTEMGLTGRAGKQAQEIRSADRRAADLEPQVNTTFGGAVYDIVSEGDWTNLSNLTAKTFGTAAPQTAISAAALLSRNPKLAGATVASIFGLSTAGKTTEQGLEVGMTEDEAKARGIVFGAIEAGSEYLPFEVAGALTKRILAANPKSAGEFAKRALQTAGIAPVLANTEAMEEWTTSVGQDLIDRLAAKYTNASDEFKAEVANTDILGKAAEAYGSGLAGGAVFGAAGVAGTAARAKQLDLTQENLNGILGSGLINQVSDNALTGLTTQADSLNAMRPGAVDTRPISQERLRRQADEQANAAIAAIPNASSFEEAAALATASIQTPLEGPSVSSADLSTPLAAGTPELGSVDTVGSGADIPGGGGSGSLYAGQPGSVLGDSGSLGETVPLGVDTVQRDAGVAPGQVQAKVDVGTGDIVTSSGAPYQTQAGAQAQLKAKGLEGQYEVKQVEGGFALAKIQQTQTAAVPEYEDPVLPAETGVESNNLTTVEPINATADRDLDLIQRGVNADVLRTINEKRAADKLEPLTEAGSSSYSLEDAPENTLRITPVRRLGIRLLAKAFGKKVRYIQDRNGKKLFFHGLYGGSIGADENTIFLDAKGDHTLLRVAGHEILHALRTQSPDIYDTLVADVSPFLNAETAKAELASRQYPLLDRQGRAWEDQSSEGREETIADLVGDRMVDPKFWVDMAVKMASSKAQQFLSTALDVMKKALKGVSGSPLSAQDKATVKKAHDSIVTAMAEYKRRVDSGEVSSAEDTAGGIQYATKNTSLPEGKNNLKSNKLDKVVSAEQSDAAATVSSKPGRGFEVDGDTVSIVTYPEAEDLEFATSRLHARIRDVLRSSQATQFLEQALGAKSKSLKLGSIRGLWAGEREDTFVVRAKTESGEALSFDETRILANILGFAFLQEGAVTSAPSYTENMDGIPSVMIGKPDGSELSRAEVDAALAAANDVGFFGASEALSGKGIKFLFFADDSSELSADEQHAAFIDQIKNVQQATGLLASKDYESKSALDSAKEYAQNGFIEIKSEQRSSFGGSQETGLGNSGSGRSDLFRGIVDNLLAPYIAGLKIEGFDFDYNNWQRVFNAGSQETEYLKAKVAELEDVNKHGVIKKLRQRVSIVGLKDVGTKAKITLKTTAVNAEEQLTALDEVLEASGDAAESSEAWLRMYARAYGTNDVPMAPNRFIEMLNSDGIYDQLKTLNAGQVDDADQGFAAGREFRQLYEAGKVKPSTTAKLMLWSFLSRGVSPFVQESAFVELVDKVDPFVAKMLNGTFSEADVTAWEKVVASTLEKGSGQPGLGSTHNANAFASSFMRTMAAPMPDGRSKMQYVHDLFSDPKQTGRSIRREFVKLSEGVGIDNKVISFTMLVIGHDDVAVLDRVQIANTHNDGRLGDYNLYDGVSRYGYKDANGKVVWLGSGDIAKAEASELAGDDDIMSAALPGSGMANLTTGVRGLMIYESIERALDAKLPDIYSRLKAAGLRSDSVAPTAGRWHWESWVSYSGQEASHKTLDALLNEVKGTSFPFADVSAKEGEYGAYSYATEYAVDRQGNGYKTYPLSTGKLGKFTLPGYKDFMAAIKKPANKVVPAKFKVSQNEDGSQRTAPWFTDPRVNRAKLDELVGKYADSIIDSTTGIPQFSRKALSETSQLVALNERARAKATWGKHLDPRDHLGTTEGEDVAIGNLLNNLYLLAAQRKDAFDDFVKQLAKATGTKAKIAPLKKRERTMQKIMTDYNGEVADMKDVLRATIATDSMAQAQQLYEALSADARVADVKGALKSSLETGTGAGYRDAKVIIDVDGVPAELIIAPQSLLRAKELAHSMYVDQRELDIKMQEAGTDAMKALYRKQIEKLDTKMVEIYLPAAQRAQSSSAVLREQGSALSRTVSMLNGLLSGSNAKNPAPISAIGRPSKSQNLVSSGSAANGDDIVDTSNDIIPQGNNLRYSRKIDPKVKDWAVSIKNRKAAKPVMLIVDEPSKALNAAGVYRQVTMDEPHVRHVYNKHAEITPDDIASLPSALQNPRAGIARPDGSTRLIIDGRDALGNPLAVALNNLNVGEGKGKIKVTEVSTLFGNEDSASLIVNSLLDGSVKYLRENEVDRLTGLMLVTKLPANVEGTYGVGIASPLPENQSLPTSGPIANQPQVVSIQTENGVVNLRVNDDAKQLARGLQFSRKQTETPEFKRWFGDSKVVDANGEPLVVYHGGRKGINAFNNPDGKYKTGIFFSDEKSIAEAFAGKGEVYPTYLKFSKPFTFDAKNAYYLNISTPSEMAEFTDLDEVDTDLIAEWAFTNGYDGVILKNVLEGRGGAGDVYIASKNTQIKSAIGNNGEFDPNNPDIRFARKNPTTGSQFALPDETTGEGFIRQWQNDQVRWKRQMDVLREKGVVNDQNDVYQAMERMVARAMNRTEDFYKNNVTPVLQRMNDLGVTLDEVGEYLYALHAKERNAAIRDINPRFANAGYNDVGGSGMSDAEADQIVQDTRAKANFADVESIAREFRSWAEANLDGLVQGGLLTQQQAADMRAKYPNYVPLQGFEDMEGETMLGQGAGFSNAKNVVKRALGRGSRAGNPAVYIIHGVAEGMLAREKANVGRYLERLILDNPDDKLWTIGQPEKEPVMGKSPLRYEVMFNGTSAGTFMSKRQAQQYIQLMNLKGATIDETGGDPTVIERDLGYDPDSEVRFLRDGKEVRIQLKDPLLARAYNNRGMEEIGTILRASAGINSFLREMWTQKNPVFPFVNVIRDIPAGALYATGEHGVALAARLIRNTPSAWYAMWQQASGKPITNGMAQWVKEYRVAGGGIGFRMVGDIQSTMDKINRIEKQLGNKSIAQALAGGEIKEAGKRLLWKTYNNAVTDFIEKVNIAFENMTRLAIFKAAREQNLSMAEAARLAKNATVNFNRKGEKTPNLNALYLFANASVQDLAKNKRTIMDAGSKYQAQAILAAVAAFGFAAAMLTDDDDELDEENRNVNNVRFKIGDKRVSIPLSYGLIGFTHYLGRSVAMALKGEDVSLQSLRLASALITNTAPVNPIPNPDRLDGTNAIIGMMPTPLEFPASVFLNRNSFGSDMRPDYNDNPDAYKAFRGTRGSVYADIAAFLNENTGGTTRESGFIDVSPETLKGFMHFTLGGTGKFVADSASTTRDLLDGGGLNENNVPLLNRFVKTEDVSTYRARFYRQAGEAKDKLELYNKYLKDGNSEKRRELAPWVILGRRGNMMWKQMNAIRDRELKISRDDTLTTAERDAQLKALADKQIDLSEKYHRLYKRKTEGA